MRLSKSQALYLSYVIVKVPGAFEDASCPTIISGRNSDKHFIGNKKNQ